jgi:hypothetical protein
MTPAIPLPHLAHSLAEELRHAAELADGLQGALVLDRAGDVSGGFLQSAQGLDLLTQKLQALHSFVRDLCELLPADFHLDPTPATRTITLASVKDRLSGSGRVSAAPAAAVEFF